jgi:exodeoxyribonuclease V gamma subunit
LPVYCATSAAYAAAVVAGKDATSAARKAWESAKFPAEDADDEHQLVLGGVLAFDDLLLATPCEGEEGEGWSEDEVSRFGRYAHRMWSGLLAIETLDDR